jgi:hypothetical protein
MGNLSGHHFNSRRTDRQVRCGWQIRLKTTLAHEAVRYKPASRGEFASGSSKLRGLISRCGSVHTHVTLFLVQASQRKTARSLNVYVINLGPYLRKTSVTHR